MTQHDGTSAPASPSSLGPHGYETPGCITNYADPDTIDVWEVVGNITRQYERSLRSATDQWDATASWPNVTVMAMANEIKR